MYLVLDKHRIVSEEMGHSDTRKELCAYISERHWKALSEHVCSCGSSRADCLITSLCDRGWFSMGRGLANKATEVY